MKSDAHMQNTQSVQPILYFFSTKGFYCFLDERCVLCDIFRPPGSMVFSAQEKAHCVVWYAVYKSVVLVQRQFRAHFLKHGNGKASVPNKNNIKAWHDQFLASGDVCCHKRNGVRWIRTDATVDEALPLDMVKRAIDSYQRRLTKCLDMNGKSVE